MAAALFDVTTIDILCGPYTFRAQGKVMKFRGYTILYQEVQDDEGEEGQAAQLPEVAQGETLELLDIQSEQKFTQPPPRYTEASLVKELEERGIGRPSTYAAIISTIQERGYVRMEEKKFAPTELGMIVTNLLVKNFPQIMDVQFTAALETKLDQIEQGATTRLDTLSGFYRELVQELEKAKKEMEDMKGEGIPTDMVCDKCGKPMVLKLGRNGRFYCLLSVTRMQKLKKTPKKIG